MNYEEKINQRINSLEYYISNHYIGYIEVWGRSALTALTFGIIQIYSETCYHASL